MSKPVLETKEIPESLGNTWGMSLNKILQTSGFKDFSAVKSEELDRPLSAPAAFAFKAFYKSKKPKPEKQVFMDPLSESMETISESEVKVKPILAATAVPTAILEDVDDDVILPGAHIRKKRNSMRTMSLIRDFVDAGTSIIDRDEEGPGSILESMEKEGPEELATRRMEELKMFGEGEMPFTNARRPTQEQRERAIKKKSKAKPKGQKVSIFVSDDEDEVIGLDKQADKSQASESTAEGGEAAKTSLNIELPAPNTKVQRLSRSKSTNQVTKPKRKSSRVISDTDDDDEKLDASKAATPSGKSDEDADLNLNENEGSIAKPKSKAKRRTKGGSPREKVKVKAKAKVKAKTAEISEPGDATAPSKKRKSLKAVSDQPAKKRASKKDGTFGFRPRIFPLRIITMAKTDLLNDSQCRLSHEQLRRVQTQI